MRRPPRWAVPGVVAVAALLVAGCTGGGPRPGQTSPPPAPPSAAPSAAASTPAPDVSSTSPTPVQNSYEPPRRTPGRPDPSTAGGLSARSFPKTVLGFTAVAEEAEEGEYNANGTWVHARNGTQAAFEAMPQCTAVAIADIPKPADALAATYRDKAGAPGNGLALEFTTASAARGYFRLYARQLGTCPSSGDAMLVVSELSVHEPVLVSRRTYPGQQRWSEMVKLDGKVVVMLIVADGQRASVATLRSTAATL